jgi:hypothetical protein
MSFWKNLQKEWSLKNQTRRPQVNTFLNPIYTKLIYVLTFYRTRSISSNKTNSAQTTRTPIHPLNTHKSKTHPNHCQKRLKRPIGAPKGQRIQQTQDPRGAETSRSASIRHDASRTLGKVCKGQGEDQGGDSGEGTVY